MPHTVDQQPPFFQLGRIRPVDPLGILRRKWLRCQKRVVLMGIPSFQKAVGGMKLRKVGVQTCFRHPINQVFDILSGVCSLNTDSPVAIGRYLTEFYSRHRLSQPGKKLSFRAGAKESATQLPQETVNRQKYGPGIAAGDDSSLILDGNADNVVQFWIFDKRERQKSHADTDALCLRAGIGLADAVDKRLRLHSTQAAGKLLHSIGNRRCLSSLNQSPIHLCPPFHNMGKPRPRPGLCA